MSGKPVHFLLVEDDDDHADLIRLSLLAEDSILKTVDRVRDGAEALAYLIREGAYKNRPRPHVVLLDLQLKKNGGINGQDVLAAMKADPELCGTPVVVLTSSHIPTQMRTAYAHRANSYLCKPASFNEFDQMIKALARYWGGVNYTPDRQDTPPAANPPPGPAGT
ncbi:MAG TPA: response regulator [Phycisphaerae bacterium]|nr:response regulator [Phycisphaerae bacterium]